MIKRSVDLRLLKAGRIVKRISGRITGNNPFFIFNTEPKEKINNVRKLALTIFVFSFLITEMIASRTSGKPIN